MRFDDDFDNDQDFDFDDFSGSSGGKYENINPVEFIKKVNKYLVSVQALESPTAVKTFSSFIKDMQEAIGNLEKGINEMEKNGDEGLIFTEFLKDTLQHSRIFYNTFLNELTKVEYTEEEHQTAKLNMASVDDNLDRLTNNLKKCKKLAVIVDRYLCMREKDTKVVKALDDNDCKNLLGTFLELNGCVEKLETSVGRGEMMNRDNISCLVDTAERSDDLLKGLKECAGKINSVFGTTDKKRRGSMKDREKTLKKTKNVASPKRKVSAKETEKPSRKSTAKRRKKTDL